MPLHFKSSKTLICFSHLRWNFVYQRPQHILTKLAKIYQIIFIEEPVTSDTGDDYYQYHTYSENLVVVIPHLRINSNQSELLSTQKKLFDQFMAFRSFSNPIFWYYTPMALEFTRKHEAALTIFDCMDELSAFRFAPENLKALERELLTRADVVFTGGKAIYEVKKNRHSNIHSVPSSVDTAHFARARALPKKNGPVRLGYFGVIDERFDAELIRQMAENKPEWHFIIVGPVVKIDPATLPMGINIHYPGIKSYQELPAELANWDIALIPFLLNESTRFISPTKTPEYLAAGKPVISTPIRDVIDPYGKQRLVHIGHNAADFIAAAEAELQNKSYNNWLERVDNFLSLNSWEQTVNKMQVLINETLENKANQHIASNS